jgi:hypothetical protein
MKLRECLLLFGPESSVFQFAIKNIKIKIQRNIILPVVLLYGCETLFLTQRQKHGLQIFSYKVLRKILWHGRDEVSVKSKTA